LAPPRRMGRTSRRQTHTRILATWFLPELFKSFAPRKEEGAGKAGCALHPRSHVQCASQENAHEHTGSAEAVRPSLRNGSTAYFALSPVTGLSCHRRPCEALASQGLDTSVGVSGPHDFAVRVGAVRYRHFRVHRIPSRVSWRSRAAPLVGTRPESYAGDLPPGSRVASVNQKNSVAAIGPALGWAEALLLAHRRKRSISASNSGTRHRPRPGRRRSARPEVLACRPGRP